MKKNLFTRFAQFFVTLVFISLTLNSCKGKNNNLQFDSSDPLATAPRVEWILIRDPFVACHTDADYESDVATHFKRGNIMMVEGKQSVKVDGVYEDWYALKEGWVPGSSVLVFSNKLKAQSAAKELFK